MIKHPPNKFTNQHVLVLWVPQLWQVKKTHPTKLQALVLVEVIATVVTSCWLSWKNNPSNYGWNKHMFENDIENCLRCKFCLGRHVHHTAVTPSASKTAMEAPKLMVYLDTFPVSICQVPCCESCQKKEPTDTFLLNSHLLRGIGVTMGELGVV